MEVDGRHLGRLFGGAFQDEAAQYPFGRRLVRKNRPFHPFLDGPTVALLRSTFSTHAGIASGDHRHRKASTVNPLKILRIDGQIQNRSTRVPDHPQWPRYPQWPRHPPSHLDELNELPS